VKQTRNHLIINVVYYDNQLSIYLRLEMKVVKIA